jgi:hypothetical protein
MPQFSSAFPGINTLFDKIKQNLNDNGFLWDVLVLVFILLRVFQGIDPVLNECIMYARNKNKDT